MKPITPLIRGRSYASSSHEKSHPGTTRTNDQTAPRPQETSFISPEMTHLHHLLDQALELSPSRQKAFLNNVLLRHPHLYPRLKQLLETIEVRVPQEFLEPNWFSSHIIASCYQKLKRRVL